MDKKFDSMLGLGNSWQARGKALTIDDIQDLLVGFDAAIEQDQVRADALTRVGLHAMITRQHVPSVALYVIDVTYPSCLAPWTLSRQKCSKQLTWIARCYEPADIGDAILNLFSEAISGRRDDEELRTATGFFGRLIEDVRRMPSGILRSESARALMMQWLPATDPLRIGDEEFGHGTPTD